MKHGAANWDAILPFRASGNVFGMVGMAIAILTTIALIAKESAQFGSNLGLGLALLFAALVVGGGLGASNRCSMHSIIAARFWQVRGVGEISDGSEILQKRGLLWAPLNLISENLLIVG